MRRLTLPTKYQNHGLYIWCTTCKRGVTANPCDHATKQRYQSRIYNPITKRQDCIRSYATTNAKEAFKEHQAYKKELEQNKYARPQVAKLPVVHTHRHLKECAQLYFDHIEDVNVPDYAKKHLSKQHISDTQRYITRFLKMMQSMEGKVSTFPVTEISSRHVDGFDKLVLDLNLSKRSYNAHMVAVRYFIQHLIDHRGISFVNPFSQVRQKHISFSPEILTHEEFLHLISVITPENGIGYRGRGENRQAVNYYRPWLAQVYKMALLIGERRDGLVLLKWKDVKGNYIGLPNWKLNNRDNTDRYYSYAPITRDLADLLVQFEIGEPEDYIILPEKKNRNTIKSLLTKSFTHFWSHTNNPKEVTFKNLRKTYATRMRELMGDKANKLKHTNEDTLLKHYIAEKELMEEYNVITLYDWK
jgi:integrase